MYIAKAEMATALVAFFYGVLKIRSFSLELKLLLVLTGVSFACDMGAVYHKELNIGVNYFSDAYRLAEFVLLLMIYYIAFKNPRRLIPFIGLALFYVMFLAYNVVYVQREKINTYTLIVLAAVFIVFAVLYFYKVMKDRPTQELHRLPMFWINVAVLVYFAGNLFLWIIVHYLVTVLKNDLIVYWSFHNVLSMIKNFLYAAAFYVSVRPRTAEGAA
jgi:hypothetical protein